MRILLIDDSKSRLVELGRLLQDLPSVGFMEVKKAIYMKPPPGLDAVFMILTAAERWNPNFRSREMQILRTSREDQEGGFPPLIVTGVNLAPRDPKDPVSQVRIVLKEAVDAARAYNSRNPGGIGTLGFWVMTLTRVWATDRMREVTLAQLSELLHRILANDPEAQ